MRICEACNREFKTGNSYRVHKSLKHRQQPNAVIEEPVPKLQELESVQAAPKEAPKPTSEPKGWVEELDKKPREVSRNNSNHDDVWAWVAGGAAVVGAIILMFL